MKIVNFIILLLIISCSSKKQVSQYLIESDNYLFAKELSENQYEILKDTVEFKQFLENELPFKTKINLTKVEIKKQLSISDKPFPYFFVKVTNASGEISISKWLEKKGNKLYFIENYENEEASMRSNYTICKGKEKCGPEFFYTDSIKGWNCSKELICLVGQNDSIKLPCQTYKTVILRD
ncbi:hypothetical protein FLAVO9AF_270022 [Flavobacterium sp. 9AF]|uniref:hypothetical protein n=1 Tax=Flavobacterium sp. 9AF TaxID=2653142 RepID=UPI0012F0B13F|nr:hypothetical protein [Flavobacterium sp. 9AF]VXB78295.1 hypothetical protein FLAVO9AF_270022 [Flavobacterium sp. 9AF]